MFFLTCEIERMTCYIFEIKPLIFKNRNFVKVFYTFHKPTALRISEMNDVGSLVNAGCDSYIATSFTKFKEHMAQFIQFQDDRFSDTGWRKGYTGSFK